MPWIRTTRLEEVSGELKEIYDAIASARGGVAEVHQVQSLNPRAMRAHLDLYRAVMFQRSTISRITRERIGVIVSAANKCSYCVAHHGEALRQLGDDPAIVALLERGEIPGLVGPSEASLLRWADRAARDPSACGESHVAGLREAGIDDRGILDAVLTVAYFSFVNRLVLLLGVGLEGDFEKTCRNGSAGE